MEFRKPLHRRSFLKGTAAVIGGIAGTIVFGPGILKLPAKARAVGSVGSSTLAPGVAEFIGNTYLVHKMEFPDSNETVGVLKLYLQGMQQLQDGMLDESVATMKTAVSGSPDSRHAQAGLGRALLSRYEALGDRNDLGGSIVALTRATRIGISNGVIRYTEYLRRALVEDGDPKLADGTFSFILAAPTKRYLAHWDYALVLADFGRDAEAEWHFAAAHGSRPSSNIGAGVSYAEWLLTKGRFGDVLNLLSPDKLTAAEDIPWVAFLRGCALDALGNSARAVDEYVKYAEQSRVAPVPIQYKRGGSTAQQDARRSGLAFEDDVLQMMATCSNVIIDLAKLVTGEARGESLGDMRCVAWTVRTRVVKGDVPCCLPTGNSGSTLNQKYCNVIYSGAFGGAGYTPYGQDPFNAAFAVYYGTFPDPVADWCPAGTKSGSRCEGSCSAQNTDSANFNSARWFAALPQNDACPYPYTAFGSCACRAATDVNGKPCPDSDDSTNHCYYKRTNNDSCCSSGCSC